MSSLMMRRLSACRVTPRILAAPTMLPGEAESLGAQAALRGFEVEVFEGDRRRGRVHGCDVLYWERVFSRRSSTAAVIPALRPGVEAHPEDEPQRVSERLVLVRTSSPVPGWRLGVGRGRRSWCRLDRRGQGS
jgi:hypothetical protein